MERAKIIYEVIGAERNIKILALENFLDSMEIQTFIGKIMFRQPIINPDSTAAIREYTSSAPYFLKKRDNGLAKVEVKIITDINVPNATVLHVGSILSGEEFGKIVISLKTAGNRLSKILRKFKPPVSKVLEI
jgi:hypothetical protein